MSDDAEAPSRLAYRISKVSQLTGLSERYLYELAQKGSLPVVRVGRAILVRSDDLDLFLANHAVHNGVDQKTESSS